MRHTAANIRGRIRNHRQKAKTRELKIKRGSKRKAQTYRGKRTIGCRKEAELEAISTGLDGSPHKTSGDRVNTAKRNRMKKGKRELNREKIEQ